jgi:uncharacterized protein (DUF2141 family)
MTRTNARGRFRAGCRLTLVVVLTLLPVAGQTEDARLLTVTGRIVGATGTHTVGVALWRSDSFMQKPAQTVALGPGSKMEFSFAVPAGEWAVSAYEDINGNGKLDMGFFGPKEPTGFWRPFTGRRKPTFKDVSFAVTLDTSGIVINLK